MLNNVDSTGFGLHSRMSTETNHSKQHQLRNSAITSTKYQKIFSNTKTTKRKKASDILNNKSRSDKSVKSETKTNKNTKPKAFNIETRIIKEFSINDSNIILNHEETKEVKEEITAKLSPKITSNVHYENELNLILPKIKTNTTIYEIILIYYPKSQENTTNIYKHNVMLSNLLNLINMKTKDLLLIRVLNKISWNDLYYMNENEERIMSNKYINDDKLLVYHNINNKNTFISDTGFEDIYTQKTNVFRYWTSLIPYETKNESIYNIWCSYEYTDSANIKQQIQKRKYVGFLFYDINEIISPTQFTEYKDAFNATNNHILYIHIPWNTAINAQDSSKMFPFNYGYYTNTTILKYIRETLGILPKYYELIIINPIHPKDNIWLRWNIKSTKQIASCVLKLFPRSSIFPNSCPLNLNKQIYNFTDNDKKSSNSLWNIITANSSLKYIFLFFNENNQTFITWLNQMYSSINKLVKRIEIISYPNDKSWTNMWSMNKDVLFYTSDYADISHIYNRYNKAYTIPKLTIIDIQGNVIKDNCINMLEDNSNFIEYLKWPLVSGFQQWHLSFLGDEFEDNTNSAKFTREILENKTFVFLVFISSWCFWGDNFITALKEICERGKEKIVVLVNNVDDDKKMFYSYNNTLSKDYYFIPFECRRNWYDNYVGCDEDAGIPMLIVFDGQNGEVVGKYDTWAKIKDANIEW